MAKKGLNLDIKKSVLEFESVAKKLNLDIDKKKVDSIKKRDNKMAPNKKVVKNLSLLERQLLLKKWKKIFSGFLIFSILIFLVIIFIISSYYKTQFQEEEKIIFDDESYISGSIHFEPRLNNSFFYVGNFTRTPEKNIQNFIIPKDEDCIPNILCKYVGYSQEYDLSTIVNEDFSLDKRVINCYDSSNCLSNFTYLESSEESFSKQKIMIQKEGKNKLNIYDENNDFVVKLEKRDLGYMEGLYI
jgi:hypothetical protein